MTRVRAISLAAVLVCIVLPAASRAASLEPLGSFEQPIFVTSDPSTADRLFVVEREGTIKLVQGGVATTFADLTAVVQCCEGERGLLSVAFAPDFPASGLLYVYYTGTDGPGNIHIAELQASGDSALISTLRDVITIGHSTATNHNGGQLQFGPDGYLFIATGDGGAGGAPARDLGSRLGKILRISPYQTGSEPYSVPSDNPYVGTPGALPEIWSSGLRNPWRFSFDRGSGALLIGDVGENSWEEVDYSPASDSYGKGDDFGWHCREGMHPFVGCTGDFTEPIFEYPHSGPCSSITGGYVVRDAALGDLYGRYLYGDFCSGQIRSLIPALPLASGDRSEGLATPAFTLSSFGEDACGRLYVASFDGTVFRIVGDTPSVCPSGGTQTSSPPSSSSSSRQDTDVRLRARRKRVERGSRAKLTAKARPCPGRDMDRVILRRNGTRISRKRLDSDCKAVFRPRISERSRFRAVVPFDEAHRKGKSNRVRVRVG